MSGCRANVLRLLALLLASGLARASAQSSDPLTTAAQAPAMELPPLIVAETSAASPWLYAQVNGTEYLSRCSIETTRAYAEQWERALQLMWTIVPDTLLPRAEIPSITVLYSQKLAQTTTPELLRELKQQRPAPDRSGFGHHIAETFYRFAPNMRLNDRDLYTTFVFIDEMNFAARRLSVAPEYLRFMLDRRVPALPPWFIEGVDQVYRDASFSENSVTVRSILWVDTVETAGLMRDRSHPRVLLPASELFAPDALRGRVNGNARRVETMHAQVALFVRWALEQGPATREALWRFAAHAATEPASESMFEACFGFGYAELRDRLSDYLLAAVRQPLRLELGKPPRQPRIAVRRATPGEVARLRGEWERLALGLVQKRLPHLQERYVEQARRTLQRAYHAGDREPRLLATLGLCELAAGDPTAARLYLDTATAASVVRPRAYYELARMRYAELRGDRSLERLFSPAELAPVIDLLHTAAAQKPLLPESFLLLGEALARSSGTPSAADFALLELGARSFARRADVSFQLAVAFARHGKNAAAEALLKTGAAYAPDDATRARFAQLRESLRSAPARSRPLPFSETQTKSIAP